MSARARMTSKTKTGGNRVRSRRKSNPRRTPLQRDVLRDVMLSAAECDAWLTLEELARLTSYPPASISAQLRHLRKTRHGGYGLKKRCRVMPKPAAGMDAIIAHGPLWEYRLDRRRIVPRIVVRRSVLRSKPMQTAASA